jgi:hypothetical protein
MGTMFLHMPCGPICFRTNPTVAFAGIGSGKQFSSKNWSIC